MEFRQLSKLTCSSLLFRFGGKCQDSFLSGLSNLYDWLYQPIAKNWIHPTYGVLDIAASTCLFNIQELYVDSITLWKCYSWYSIDFKQRTTWWALPQQIGDHQTETGSQHPFLLLLIFLFFKSFLDVFLHEVLLISPQSSLEGRKTYAPTRSMQCLILFFHSPKVQIWCFFGILYRKAVICWKASSML